MAKRYSIAPTVEEDKKGPSNSCLQTILSFSKSLESKRIKAESHLIHLN